MNHATGTSLFESYKPVRTPHGSKPWGWTKGYRQMTDVEHGVPNFHRCLQSSCRIPMLRHLPTGTRAIMRIYGDGRIYRTFLTLATICGTVGSTLSFFFFFFDCSPLPFTSSHPSDILMACCTKMRTRQRFGKGNQ